jgi:glycogen synthase
MVARVPVIVSSVGGLQEVVDHGVTGLTAWADNPDSLAWAVLRMLKNPYSAQQMAENAYRKVVDQFNWGRIGDQTLAVYDRVWSEFQASDWGGARDVGEVAGPARKSRRKPVADTEKL